MDDEREPRASAAAHREHAHLGPVVAPGYDDFKNEPLNNPIRYHSTVDIQVGPSQKFRNFLLKIWAKIWAKQFFELKEKFGLEKSILIWPTKIFSFSPIFEIILLKTF